jgi:hypothetical protein
MNVMYLHICYSDDVVMRLTLNYRPFRMALCQVRSTLLLVGHGSFGELLLFSIFCTIVLSLTCISSVFDRISMIKK